MCLSVISWLACECTPRPRVKTTNIFRFFRDTTPHRSGTGIQHIIQTCRSIPAHQGSQEIVAKETPCRSAGPWDQAPRAPLRTYEHDLRRPSLSYRPTIQVCVCVCAQINSRISGTQGGNTRPTILVTKVNRTKDNITNYPLVISYQLFVSILTNQESLEPDQRQFSYSGDSARSLPANPSAPTIGPASWFDIH